MTTGEAPPRVAVSGAKGKVGREIVAGLQADPAFECVAEIDLGDNLSEALQTSGAQAMVDFTTPTSGLTNALTAADLGVAPIIGTTGLGPDGITQVRDACTAQGIGGCVIPNFAIGAVILMWLAQRAAPYFDTAEIIEAHNPNKHDAPSGTALRTAQLLLDARDGKPFQHSTPRTEPLEHTRGGELGGISLHALRLSGVVADQSVILGAESQTLALEHRTTSRAVYVPGVLMACRAVTREPRFFDSLEGILGLPSTAELRASGIIASSP